jgi:hypothetical protein
VVKNGNNNDNHDDIDDDDDICDDDGGWNDWVDVDKLLKASVRIKEIIDESIVVLCLSLQLSSEQPSFLYEHTSCEGR